ncbi:hypothetical protein [Desulfitobacterium chlororespirans]|uniref:Uncharacterized protein n=1 Tax=Desulfitobacterium chlororespirans DSM 11544 TaxID=1121395 RepID=A0A1M7UYA4_9FIRM|nr:hypothetical protein [Desulfitobacterium chlororespirans]SHN87896.1 hypothetical protein SAMN02745215_05013 [Desulfitobacterium chlororespirans DSM 11544]
MSRQVSRKTIIELFIYAFLLIISIILLIQDKQESMSINIHPEFRLHERSERDAIVPNE